MYKKTRIMSWMTSTRYEEGWKTRSQLFSLQVFFFSFSFPGFATSISAHKTIRREKKVTHITSRLSLAKAWPKDLWHYRLYLRGIAAEEKLQIKTKMSHFFIVLILSGVLKRILLLNSTLKLDRKLQYFQYHLTTDNVNRLTMSKTGVGCLTVPKTGEKYNEMKPDPIVRE